MVGIATVDINADRTRLIADVAVTGGADVAIVAADPGIDHDPVADRNAISLITKSNDLALDFVAHGKR